MYQQNCKKTHHPEMICDFALFLIDAGAALLETDCNRMQYLHRAEKLLKQLAARGHPAPHYHLGTLYMSGVMKKGKQQLLKAFPYFLQAAKLHHQGACFR
jgi:TPR repeat protein